MIRKVIVIELYRSYFEGSTFLKLLQKKGCDVELYAFFEKQGKQFLGKFSFVVREFVCLLKFIFKLPQFKNKKVFCMGGFYAILFICRLFSLFLGKNFHLYIYNFYIHGTGDKKYVQAILRFLFNNPHCTLIVQSPKEVGYYQKLSSVIPVWFVPYSSDMEPPSLESSFTFPQGNYIFTGGYTNRDYGIVQECARNFPDQQFVVVASNLNTDIKNNKTPANLTLYRNIERNDFELLLAHATIVLIPLKSDVGASGQMLCISAMYHKRPIIFSDVSSISYYFERNISGIPYNLGDKESLFAALDKLIHNPALQKSLGESAYSNYRNHYTSEGKDAKLFDILNGNEQNG
jgi:glycosyltransferase involved in cell wall biosynthesis